MNRNVWMASLIAGLFAFALNIGVFLVPTFSTDMLGATDAQVGLLVAAPGILAMLLMLPSAPISNRLGRRRVMLFSTSTSVVAAALFLTARSFQHLLAAQIVFGASNAFFWPSNLAYSCEVAEPGAVSQAQAANTAAQGVGLVLGPIVAGILAQRTGYQGALWAWLACALANLGLVIYLQPLPVRAQEERLGSAIARSLQMIPSMCHNTKLVIAMLSQLLAAAFVISIGGAFFILFLQDVGYTAMLASLMLSLRELFGTISRAMYANMRRHISNQMILSLVPLIAGAALLVGFAYPTLPVLLVVVAVEGFALGLTAPAGNTEASEHASEENLAEHIAAVVVMFQVGTVVFPTITGLLIRKTNRGYGLMAATLLVMLISIWPLMLSLRGSKKSAGSQHLSDS